MFASIIASACDGDVQGRIRLGEEMDRYRYLLHGLLRTLLGQILMGSRPVTVLFIANICFRVGESFARKFTKQWT